MSTKKQENDGLAGCISHILGILAMLSCPFLARACDAPAGMLFSRGAREVFEVGGREALQGSAGVIGRTGDNVVVSMLERNHAIAADIGDALRHGISASPFEQAGHLRGVVDLSEGRQAIRVGDDWFVNEGQSTRMITNFYEEIDPELAQRGYLVADTVASESEAQGARLTTQGPPSGSKLIEAEIELNGQKVPVKIDPETGQYYVKLSEVPASARPQLGDINIYFKEFSEDLTDQDLHGLAGKIVESVDAAKPLLEANFNQGVKQTDELLKAGEHKEALKLVDQLIIIHGEQPDLTLRKGLIQLSLGQKQAEIITTLNVTQIRSFKDSNTFFDEINKRLATPSLPDTEATALQRIAEFGDWTDHLGRHPELVGRPQLALEEGQMALAFQLDDPLKDSVSVPLEAVFKNNGAAVYVDTASLNNLDWTVSIQDTLIELPSGELPSVLQLTRVDIAHFNPAAIYVGDQPVLHQARQSTRGVNSGQLTKLYRPYRASQDDEEREEEESFYLVLEAPEKLTSGGLFQWLSW